MESTCRVFAPATAALLSCHEWISMIYFLLWFITKWNGFWISIPMCLMKQRCVTFVHMDVLPMDEGKIRMFCGGVLKFCLFISVWKKYLWDFLITFIFDRCHRSIAAVTYVKYGCDIEKVKSVIVILKTANNGTNEIGLVAPTLGGTVAVKCGM